MNKEIIEKLDLPISKLNFSTRVLTALNCGEISKVIQIYQFQQGHGGYPFATYSTNGLRKLRNFGRISLADVEHRLKQFGLPDLKSAQYVIRCYESSIELSTKTSSHDSLICDLLEGVLRVMGKKHDPDILRQIMILVS